ncbi:MAG: MoaD/ThiS family protein [Halofilum sp. (in: g-proteobacteria)]
MTVQVKVFAHLRERLGFAERSLELPEGATVAGVWEAMSGEAELPSHVLAAVNLGYAEPDDLVSDGDEVAFFPPVTGGSR